MEFMIGAVLMFVLIVLIVAISEGRDNRKKKNKELVSFNKSNFIDEIKRFDPKEGDIIIIRTPYTIKNEKVKQEIKKSYEEFLNLGPKFRIIILQHGEDIEIQKTIISADTENKMLRQQ